MSEIEVSAHQSVAILTMKRPDHGNRMTQRMAEELIEALDSIRRDPAAAGCVLTGHGDVFCLGGDYQGAGPRIAGRMEFGRAHVDLIDAMARFGKPLVAALNGNAHAGGFSLVVACDLAFAEAGVTLGLPEVAHGLFPLLALAIVRDALPKKVLFDIVYNARLLSAEEARALHLVNDVVPHGQALRRSIEAVEAASRGNPDILAIGRDLYYAMRGVSPSEALDKARFALGSALGARDERPPSP